MWIGPTLEVREPGIARDDGAEICPETVIVMESQLWVVPEREERFQDNLLGLRLVMNDPQGDCVAEGSPSVVYQFHGARLTGDEKSNDHPVVGILRC